MAVRSMLEHVFIHNPISFDVAPDMLSTFPIMKIDSVSDKKKNEENIDASLTADNSMMSHPWAVLFSC